MQQPANFIQKCSQADGPHNEQSQPGHHQFQQQEGAQNLILSLDGKLWRDTDQNIQTCESNFSLRRAGTRWRGGSGRSRSRVCVPESAAPFLRIFYCPEVWCEARLLIGGGETRETAVSPLGEQRRAGGAEMRRRRTVADVENFTLGRNFSGLRVLSRNC